MATETQATYHRNDLIGNIQERFPYRYPEQAGAMASTISSILIHLEVYAPEVFQDVMQFEMRCMERLKAEENA